MTRLVIHVIVGLGRGGAERALTRLLEAQQGSADYRHSVISLTNRGCYGEHLEKIGVDVHTLGMTGILGIPRALAALIKHLRAHRPDLVQTWMYHADLLGGMAAKVCGSPPVLWGIRSFDLKRGAKLSTRAVQKLCALFSSWLPTLILCVAEASRRSHTAVGYDESRIRVVPNGFEVPPPPPEADIANLRRAHGLPAESLVVGCVGRFHPAKDHQNFVRAAAIVATDFPNVRFLMVGPGLDWDNAQLCSWIDTAGLRERFILLGERADIALWLSVMDIFCSPSRTEAFPQVVGEAMVLGRPAVVTDVGDTALIVGDTAIVVERENPAALAAGLMELLMAEPQERRSLGMRAQQRVRREYSMTRTVECTLAAYAEALQLKKQSKRG